MFKHVSRCAVLFAFLYVGAVHTQELKQDVEELHQWCQQRGNMPAGFCYGFVGALARQMFLLGDVLKKHSEQIGEPTISALNLMAACDDGKPVTNGAMVQAFRNWAQKHPEQLSIDQHTGVIDAIKDAWPCRF